jgi:S-adenosylmethionine:tRNA ribosyltransferase-isomerase
VTDLPPRGLRTADYDFHLPADRIAQRPAAVRDESRLMVVDRAAGTIAHRVFRELPELTRPGELLVVNATRVLRARLLGTRESGAPAEVFLLRPCGEALYEAMVSPGAKLKPGRRVRVAPGFEVEVVRATERGTRVVRLLTEGSLHDAIERHGRVPLPPYVARGDETEDAERYQTVYGREAGSVAAPTAGLHFTPELLAALERRGVGRAEVVLHVGAGTFKPVEVEDPSAHAMHEEWYTVGEDAAARVNAARGRGARVWAVGTTTLRTLESATGADGTVAAGAGETRIFIRPPARVRSADALVTNFHLPRSTLLMLVAAFAGYDLTMRAYEAAVAEGYRFYSYGDAMAIV